MNINLQDKVIIVTGAAGGLGTVTVAVLQEAGAQLALVENRIEKLRSLQRTGWAARAGKLD